MSENQKRFKSVKTKAMVVGVALAVGLVAGIPMIVFGATKGITALLVIGIALVVIGFYGAPIALAQCSSIAAHGAVLAAIEDEGLGTVTMIGEHLGRNPKQVRASVDYLISHGQLKGYIVDAEGNIKRNDARAARDYVDVGKCPNCNAPLVLEDGELRCPYCGAIVRKKEGRNN